MGWALATQPPHAPPSFSRAQLPDSNKEAKQLEGCMATYSNCPFIFEVVQIPFEWIEFDEFDHLI